MSGTKDEDSRVRKLLHRAEDLRNLYLASLRSAGETILLSQPAPPSPPPGPPAAQRPLVPVHWIALAGLAGAFVAYLIGAAMGAGGADKTLDTVEASVANVSAELKTELKEMAEQRTAVAKAITELVVEVREIRKENREIVIALASLGALQKEQGDLVIRLEVRADAAKEDRLRIQGELVNIGWTADTAKSDVRTVKGRLRTLEVRVGIEQPKGDGP